jgi:cyclopropane-fatty-acyl-phospholipid synthase
MKDWNARIAVAGGVETEGGRLGPSAGPAGRGATARLASTPLDRWALWRIQRSVRSAPIQFLLWDGFELPSIAGPSVGAIVFKNRSALAAWVWDPDLNFGETYMSGAVELRGELFPMLEAIYAALGPRPRQWRLWQRSNAATVARHNVHHHYDLGNDFYRLWLDREMSYTCAYFPTPGATLEEAQIAKMDLVCRKLHLKPGERVIEAGCGWGSLALFMARHYGVSVRAFNISSNQIAYARARARDERLDDRVEFIEDDYRYVRGTCDAFVSVGMLEHVGLPDFPSLGRVIQRSLSGRGRGLLHFIGRNQAAPLNPWISKRIFPGAYAPTLREVFEHVLEPHGFSVLDVENLRLHYAKTLEHWGMRFRRSAPQVGGMFDDAFVRAWDLYLAGSQASFSTGSLQLFQVVFAPGDNHALPWTRVSG